MFKELFAKKPTPEEMVKKWRLEIRKEVRGLENNIRCMCLSFSSASILLLPSSLLILSSLFYCFLYLFSFLSLTTCTAIETEENKVKRSIKELIKKGDKKSASISINNPGSPSPLSLSLTHFPSLLPSFPLSPCPLISILIFLIVRIY